MFLLPLSFLSSNLFILFLFLNAVFNVVKIARFIVVTKIVMQLDKIFLCILFKNIFMFAYDFVLSINPSSCIKDFLCICFSVTNHFISFCFICVMRKYKHL
ncbi:hypothetical protein C6Q09_19460 [Burkholderia multivorans]|nr:hypothetical protein C6Q09_19460 [Burkholderia multivorans]